MKKQHRFSIWYAIIGMWAVLFLHNMIASSLTVKNIPYSDFVKAVKADTKPFVLDVRTEQEAAIYGITLADSVSMPMKRVFTKDTLDQIPTDRKIVVVCKGGHRATAIAMGLRQIGFKDVFILKGGFAALAKFLAPKTAN